MTERNPEDVNLSKRPSALIVGRCDETATGALDAVTPLIDWHSPQTFLGEDGRFCLYIPYLGRYPEWADVETISAALAAVPGIVADMHIAGGYGPPHNSPCATVKIRGGAWTVHAPDVRRVDPILLPWYDPAPPEPAS